MPNIHISLILMVKDEHKRLQVTLNSTIGYVNSIIAYDTGSTDDTIEILTKHAVKNNIPLYLKEGIFVNFSISRNVVLEYADTFDNVDFLLLMDVNDELRGGNNLLEFVKTQTENLSTGYLMAQEWWSGKYDKYFNMRFLKNKSGWRYRGSVHEWLKNEKYDDKDTGAPQVYKMSPDIVLYQDRTQDDDKSGKRFFRDKKLLLADHKKNPTDARTLFYLGQTCACLNHNEDCLYYYKLRSKLEGFQEEKFHALLRCGEVSEKLNHDWNDSMAWYMKSLEHSQRAEPYIKIAEHYKHINKFDLSYIFASAACRLSYPEHCILFVDKHAYDYTRWHILGIVSYYVGKYKDGKIACEKAIECGLNTDMDTR
jgi:glycosyltransferase involved in cell wall biosynthesis